MGEMWEFAVDCRDAAQVFLVKQCEEGLSSWIQMKQTSPGRWRVLAHLLPGRYRFKYFKAEGQTFLNCGTFGLVCQRHEGEDERVVVEDACYAQPA
jgi:hypothetical protein